jgi:Holliday junction resolvase RusA-like endonuclease
MRVIAEYDPKQPTPLLRFYIHGAPHRRIHQAVLKQYRKAIWEAGRAAKLPAPIRCDVELSALFINPTSPDLDNLTTALFQALDGKCGAGPTLLVDDRQIVLLKNIGILFTETRK